MVTLGEARRVIKGAELRASEIGQPINIAVVDEGGNLVSHIRMDGAPKHSGFSKGAIIYGKQSWSGIRRTGKS
jgi:uncharacterized protein GlcG (DUF336 family)